MMREDNYLIKLQNILNNLINDYLNGTHLNAIKKQSIKQLFDLFCSSKARFINIDLIADLSKKLSFGLICNETRLAEIIQLSYRILESEIRNSKILLSEQKVEVSNSFDSSDYFHYDNVLVSSITKLSNFLAHHLKDYFRGFFLHGSWATLDSIKGYSDLDTLVILNNNIFSSPFSLVRARKIFKKGLGYLFSIDPLMHHGFYFITEIDMDFFPQHYFPLELFKHAKYLYKDNDGLLFKIRDDLNERKKLLRSSLDYLEDIHYGKKFIRNAYDLKYFMSVVFLIPNFYYQVNNNFLYKKNALSTFYEDFPEELTRLFKRLSTLRERWDYSQVFIFKYRLTIFLLFGLRISLLLFKKVPDLFQLKARGEILKELKNSYPLIINEFKKSAF